MINYKTRDSRVAFINIKLQIDLQITCCDKHCGNYTCGKSAGYNDQHPDFSYFLFHTVSFEPRKMWR